MSMTEIRSIVVSTQETLRESGQAVTPATVKVIAAAVVTNPLAGKALVKDLTELELMSIEVTAILAERAVKALEALGLSASDIRGYGKGAIVGAAGELEHGALWHVPGGYAMRELLGWKGDRAAYLAGQGGVSTGQPGNALAIVASTKKVGPPSAALDVPMTHINASYVRSHFDAIEVRVPGAPRSDEIIVILAMSTGARWRGGPS